MQLAPFADVERGNYKLRRLIVRKCIYGKSNRLGKKMEPMSGIEPLTYSLRVNCSTD